MKEIGKITFKDEVHVTDPCYGIESWCSHTLKNVLPGEYLVTADSDSDGHICYLSIVNKETIGTIYDPFKMDVECSSIGVDSGLCGFFDKDQFEHFKSTEDLRAEFYDMIDSNDSDVRIIDDVGVYSSSGYGDGLYYLYVQRDNQGRAIAAELEYIDPEEIDE